MYGFEKKIQEVIIRSSWIRNHRFNSKYFFLAFSTNWIRCCDCFKLRKFVWKSRGPNSNHSEESNSPVYSGQSKFFLPRRTQFACVNKISNQYFSIVVVAAVSFRRSCVRLTFDLKLSIFIQIKHWCWINIRFENFRSYPTSWFTEFLSGSLFSCKIFDL